VAKEQFVWMLRGSARTDTMDGFGNPKATVPPAGAPHVRLPRAAS